MTEQVVISGGYGYRLLVELIQNGSDQIYEYLSANPLSRNHKIIVSLNQDKLIVANTGNPFTLDGIESLAMSHISTKRGNQIGRFGIGFKSVMNVSNRVEIHSAKLGSFYFDVEKCRQELRKKFAGVGDAPGLRLLWYMDPLEMVQSIISDQERSLMNNETVVVVHLRDQEHFKKIKDEMISFRPEFLLFQEAGLNLDFYLNNEVFRQIKRTDSGIDIELSEQRQNVQENPKKWRKFTTEFELENEEARKAATEIHRRDIIPISWAVPLNTSNQSSGAFWSFFPTDSDTWIPGILNAPWQMNTDRTAVIPTVYNQYLADQAALLIAESIKDLAKDSDPGSVFDYFPRQDPTTPIAKHLVHEVMRQLSDHPLVPNGLGEFVAYDQVARHPDGLTSKLVKLWQKMATDDQLRHHVHASVYEQARFSRFRAMMNWLLDNDAELEFPITPMNQWIGMVVGRSDSPNLSVYSLIRGVYDHYSHSEYSKFNLNECPFVLCRDGDFRAPDDVYDPDESEGLSDHETPSELVWSDETARSLLIDVFHIESKHLLSEQEQLDELCPSETEADPVKWTSFWLAVFDTPETEVREYLRTRNKYKLLRYKSVTNEWMKWGFIYSSGRLIDDSSVGPIRDHLLDETYNAPIVRLLSELGLSDMPYEVEKSVADELHISWSYQNRVSQEYNRVNNASRITDIRYAQGVSTVLALLPHLDTEKRDFLTRWLINQEIEHGCSTRVTHYTNGNYKDAVVPSIGTFWLLTRGEVSVSGVTLSIKELWRLRGKKVYTLIKDLDIIDKWFDSFPEGMERFIGFLPVSYDTFKYLEYVIQPVSIFHNTDLIEVWQEALDVGYIPKQIDFVSTDTEIITLDHVFVTTSSAVAESVYDSNPHVIILNMECHTSWVEEGAQDLDKDWSPVWNGIVQVSSVSDSFPHFIQWLNPNVAATTHVYHVVGLRFGESSNFRPIVADVKDGRLIFDAEAYSNADRSKRDEHILRCLHRLGLLERSLQETLFELGDLTIRALITDVANADTFRDKLMLMTGYSKQPLINALNVDVDRIPKLRDATLEQLADVVLLQLGSSLFSCEPIKAAMRAQGILVPERMGSTAISFVSRLGFPPEYAESQTSRRDAELWISGPMDLPKLHDFQQDVFEGIRGLVEQSSPRRRAVVSLPTGGGKTRVTVEAAVHLVLKSDRPNRTVVWIAQTDELCEQAVASFQQVWLNLGSKGVDLRINRFWGGNPNPAALNPGDPVVVVSSIQTLNSRSWAIQEDWLQKPALIVLDECHHAITTSYTNLLRWVNADSRFNQKGIEEEPILIGLSATPFRTVDEESSLLSNRFDRNILPPNQEGLYNKLIHDEVLAEAQYRAIETQVSLTDEEKRSLQRLLNQNQNYSLEQENMIQAINDRMATVNKRNNLIVESIRSAKQNSILLFANSVRHAEELAIRLSLEGIAAVSISGETPRSTRRKQLAKFHDGEIRVLCNHSVLTTGFDSPKTDLIVISRLVMSPVRYMQMVGRGLRGPKNGGTPTCEILTLIDNLGHLDSRHAYRYWMRHFSEGAKA
jgi:superfamily II DNA or RNA helicase